MAIIFQHLSLEIALDIPAHNWVQIFEWELKRVEYELGVV